MDAARFCASCGAILPTETTGPDPMIGQLIGARFRVTGILGEGGMGIVYVGEQHMGSTVRKVAIKTLHPHLSKDPSVLARFHRECGTIAQLEHPNTIKVYDFGSTADGTLYIAMEFVSGRPLSETIRTEGSLSPERVLKIVRQVCGALDEAHQTGIIHRDLKPENVILTSRAGETDFVKLLDFGIAARSESGDAQKEQKLTQQGMVLGTPPYMSPEQFTGKALDARSDIYSLGVMAYEMLTGRLPFEADTPWQWATQHMTAQPTPFESAAPSKSIPPAMRQTILRALSKERQQRPSSAHEFFAELSDGGRARVEVVSAPEHLKTGTAAMEQPPDFGGSGLPVTAVQVAPGVGGTPLGGMAMAAPAHQPLSPVASGGNARRSGNKGLIVGLGAVGTLLLLGMVVVGIRTLKPDVEPPLVTPIGTSPANGPVEVAPSETPPAEAPVAQVGATSDPTPPRASEAAPKKPAGSTKTSTPTPTPATPAPTTPTTPGPTTPAPKPASGTSACENCRALAEARNIPGAVSAARSCNDESMKRTCLARIRSSGSQAAKAAALNGNCALAQQIVAAAASVGAPISNALNGTSCK